MSKTDTQVVNNLYELLQLMLRFIYILKTAYEYINGPPSQSDAICPGMLKGDYNGNNANILLAF